MKTHIHLATITIGLLSGALLYAEDKDKSKDKSQPRDSSAQQQEQSSIESEAAGSEKSGGQKVTFNELPQPVQKTIRAHAGNLNVENIQKQTQNGETRYQAMFDKENMKGKLTVAEDGSLLRYQLAEDLEIVAAVPEVSEGDTQLSDLPDAVQERIKKEAGSAEVGNISKTSQNGQTVYHAGFNEGGAHTDLFVNEEGNLIAKSQKTALFVAPLEDSETVELSAAPEAVQQAIREEAGDEAEVADLDKGTWQGRPAYKVMIEKEGTPRALVISESGDILGQEISEAAGAENKSQKKDHKKKDKEKSKDQN